MNTKSDQLKNALGLIFATMCWGSSYVITKGRFDTFPPFLLNGLKLTLGGITVLLLFRRSLKQLRGRTLLLCAVLGALFTGGNVLQTLGIQYTSAGRCAFVTAAECVIMPFLEWWLLKNRPKFPGLLAAVICLSGIGLIVLDGDLRVNAGDVLTMGGSLCYALEIVLFGKFVKDRDDVLLTGGMLLCSGLLALALSPLTEQAPGHPDISAVLCILYMGTVCAGLSMMLQGRAQKVLSPSTVTILLSFEAVFAAAFGALFLKESFTVTALIGCALVFFSSFTSLLRE